MQKQGIGLALAVCGLGLIVGKPLLSSPQNAEDALAQAQAITCLSNQKQIALGLMMYVQDYDEMFPPKKSAYEKVIYPYIKNMKVFRCPLDAEGTISYTLNPNLQGALMAKVKEPAKTIMTFEGKPMHLDFRHSTMAAISFADGHAKLIRPEEAKDLYWYLGGKTPAADKPAKPKHGSKPHK